MKHILLPAILIFTISVCAVGQVPDTLWTSLIVDGYESAGFCVRQTSDGGFILSGNNKPNGSMMGDAFLARTDQDGNVLWTRNFGGPGYDDANSVVQTSDGGFISTGSNLSSAAESFVYTIRTDANGDTLWISMFGDSIWDHTGVDVKETIDGGYIVPVEKVLSLYKNNNIC